MKRCTVLIVCCVTITTSNLLLPQPEYRKDYEYNRHTRAFYKLHIEITHHRDADTLCRLEGASLMVPAHNEDLVLAHQMMKKYPDIGNYLWIGVDGYKHEPAEETPIIHIRPADSEEYEYVTNCDIMTREGKIETTVCYHRHPFICKVAVDDTPYDDQCGVYGFRYLYYSSVGSCYKMPLLALTWDQAYAECEAEGAHLVILNSEAEHQAVWDLIRTATKINEVQAYFFFFAGIRANRPSDGTARVFKTVFNQTLVEAGYNEWSEGEPNNYEDSEYCGAIFLNNGKYNDVNCSHLYQCVCEKEVPLNSSVVNQ